MPKGVLSAEEKRGCLLEKIQKGRGLRGESTHQWQSSYTRDGALPLKNYENL